VTNAIQHAGGEIRLRLQRDDGTLLCEVCDTTRTPPELQELSGSIEDGFRRRLDALPADTRRLLQLAAAEPVGEPLLLWRAAVQDDRLGPRLAGSFDHVLVDEYQDVNALQVDILSALRRDDSRITAVGDDAQALYSFRAAEPRHILDFDLVFPGATTVVLDTNYRSSQQILNVANAVGADATVGFSAVLHAARATAGSRPQLVRCADEDAQTNAVCDRILAHRESGVFLHDQAVLVRTAHHSALLELELAARRIPYVKYGGLRFVEAAHVKDLLAAFRLADNHHPPVARMQHLNPRAIQA